MGILWRTLGVAASVAAILLLLAQLPASAHVGVESSDPTAGAIIDTPVDEITLVFTDQTEPAGDGFRIVEFDGDIRPPNEWESPDGRTFFLRFDPPITGGETGVRWTIRGTDSHALDGSFSFIVDAEDPTVTVPAAETTSGVDDETLLSTGGASAVANETPAEDEATDSSVGAIDANEVAAPSARSTGDDQAISSAPLAVGVEAVIDVDEVNGSAGARVLGLAGRLLAMIGSLVAIGALVFLLGPLRGTTGEGRLVVKIAQRATLFIVVGSVAEAMAQVAIQGGGWTSLLSPVGWIDVLGSRFGGAIALHLIGAFGISTGSHFAREPIGYRNSRTVQVDMGRVGVLAATPRSSGITNHPPLDNAQEVGASPAPLLFRWRPTSASSGAVLGVVALLAAAVVGGHSIGESSLLLSAVVTLTHVLAGSAWVGGVIVLFSLLRRRFLANRRIEAVELAVRYSILATLSLIGVAVAGLLLTYARIDSLSQLWTTGWGRLVLAKLALVAVASALGAANHFVVIPQLVARSGDVGLGAMLKRIISAEIVVLVAIVAISAQLVATGLG